MHKPKRAHDSKVIMIVSRDLPQVSPTAPTFKLYDICMPYMASNKNGEKGHARAKFKVRHICKKKSIVKHLLLVDLVDSETTIQHFLKNTNTVWIVFQEKYEVFRKQ